MHEDDRHFVRDWRFERVKARGFEEAVAAQKAEDAEGEKILLVELMF